MTNLERLYNEYWLARQGDAEQGDRWLNEQYGADWAKMNPQLIKWQAVFMYVTEYGSFPPQDPVTKEYVIL